MKKRILSLLLAVIMIASMLPAQHVHAADDCYYDKYWGGHQYSLYVDNGDGNHSQKCVGCDSIKVTEKHTYDSWDKTSTTHAKKCSVCGSTQAATDHNWAYKKVNNYQHAKYCTVCEYEGSYESHNNEVKYDNSKHWEECSKCDYESSKSNHGSFSTTSNGNGTHSQKCGTCGYTKDAVACTPSQYSSKGTSGHQYYCNTCYSWSATVPHTMGYKQSTSYNGSTHTYGCTLCGYEVSSGKCESTKWLEEGNEHYKVCDICEQEFARGSHSGSTTDNKDGKTHTVGCSTCGQGVKKNHTMGAWKDNYNGTHSRVCSDGCGYKETAKHTPKYSGTDGNTTHKVTCTDCNAAINNNESCTFTGNYVQGDTQHWKVCSVCNTKGTMTKHSGDVTNNGASGHTIGCSTCGKGVTENHTMGNWTGGSGDQHTRTCTVNGCGYTEKENHSLQYTGTDGSESHTVACKVCNYSRSVSCTFGNYVQGETQHWKVCSLCKTKGTMTNHSGTVQKIKGDSTHHKVTCSTCDKVAVVECTFGNWQNAGNGKHEATCTEWNCQNTKSEAHTLQYTGTDNYDYHSVACKTCSYTQSRENCTFSGKYVQGETQHWKVCSVCNTKGTMTKHSGDVTSNGSTGHTISCDTCDKSTSEAHTLSNWANDNMSDQHKRGCTVNGCDYTETADHGNWTYEQYNSSQHKKSCGVCGDYEYENCTKQYTDNNDGSTHTAKCNDCGKTVTNEQHSYDYNTKTCKCGAVRHDHAWKLVVSGNKITLTCTETVGTCIDNLGELTITAPANLTYDGNAKEAVVAIASDSYMEDNGSYSISYQKKNGSNWNSVTEAKNAGTYRATVTYYLSYPYNSASATVEFAISKANATVTVEGYEGNYDGASHGITVTAPSGLDVTYSESENGYYRSTPYTYQDAGTYTVYYEVVNDGNYNITNAKGAAVVKINPLKINVTAEGYTGTYDGAEHGITVDAPAGVTVTYDVKEDGWYNYSNSPAYKNAGTYIVYYKATASKNYSINGGENIVTGSATVQINQVSLADAVKVTPYSGTYDGKAHGITVEVPDDADVYYKTSADGEWNNWPNQNPTFTDVGNYTVYYKVVSKSGNYFAGKARAAEVSVEGSSTVEIKVLDLADVLTVTAKDTEFTFNRNTYTDGVPHVNHSIELTVDKTQVPGTYDSITIEYSKDGGATWTSQNPAFRDAGEYTVKYRIYVKDYNYSAPDYMDDNYKPIEGSNKVTIHKAELPFDALHGYRGHYDGLYHYTFSHVEYHDSGWGYTYWTTYWWLDDLTYEFSWTDDDGVARTSTVTGKDNFINYYDGKVPMFRKQNVSNLSGSEPGKVVTVTISGDNYITDTFTYDIKIGPGAAYAENRTYDYDGDEHYIANYIAGLLYRGYGDTYNFGSIKIEYREKGSTQWLPASQEPGQTDVGSKDVEWRVTMDSDGNGEFGEESNTFGSREFFTGINTVTVKAVPLTVTANNNTITYGDEPAAAGATITGYVNGEDGDDVGASNLTFEFNYNKGDNAGTYTITPKGLTPKNYTVTYVPGTLTVNKKPVTIVLDETTGEPKVDPADLVSGDTCTVDEYEYYQGETKLDAAPTEPGTYKIKVIKLGNDNYEPENDVEFTIDPPAPELPELTVTADNKTIVYGETVTYTATLNPSDAVVDISGLTYDCSYVPGSDVGTYTITPDGLTSDEYDVNFVDGTLTVEQKPVQIRLSGTDPYVYPADILEGDTCKIATVTYYKDGAEVTDLTQPGNYTAEVTLTNDNYKPGNEVKFTIEPPAPPALPKLTVTAKDHTITYGDAPANNGVTINPDDDTIDLAGLAYDYDYAQGNDVGTYAITPKGLNSEKYDVTYVAGVLTVEQKPVTILIDDSVSLLDLADQIPQLKVDPEDLVGDDECQVVKVEYYSGDTKLDGAPTAPGTYRIKVIELSNDNYYPENDVEFTIVDEAPPTGNINVTTNNWNSYLTSVDFDIYFNEGKTVTITAADDIAVQSIEYYVLNASSGTHKTLAQLAAMTDADWSDYTGAFSIVPNQKVVVYAKITDTSANVTYICSDGMIFDGTAPVIDGIENGKSYKDGAEFTVTDNFALDKVTIDGKEVEPNEDGEYIIKKDNKKHTVIATDKAGNEVKLTIISGVLKTEDAVTPATGDNFNFGLMAFAMIASVAALAVLVIGKRRSTGKK